MNNFSGIHSFKNLLSYTHRLTYLFIHLFVHSFIHNEKYAHVHKHLELLTVLALHVAQWFRSTVNGKVKNNKKKKVRVLICYNTNNLNFSVQPSGITNNLGHMLTIPELACAELHVLWYVLRTFIVDKISCLNQ